MSKRSVLATIALLGGCFGNESTDFPPGLEPVAENTAPAPEGTESDPFPQRLETVHGQSDQFMFSHSRGYIHAEPSLVWAALKNVDVVSDRRNTDRRTVTANVEPEYEFSFLLHYEVDDIVTVEWDENWRYGTLVGETSAPEHAVLAFQKTFGTSFISILRGSMSMELVAPDVVLIGMVEELEAAMTESDKPAGYQADVFANIEAFTRSEPLPEF